MKYILKALCIFVAFILFVMPAYATQTCDGATCSANCSCPCNTNTVSDAWDGSADTSWYDDEQSTFVITTAEQLAGLSELSYRGITLQGKTVTLGVDIDLDGYNFEPIHLFEGVFDGDGHTISNMSIDTHLIASLSSRYIALFREVNNGTIRNLSMDHAQLIPYWDDPWQHYQCEMATVAAKTNGDCIFENIYITNSTAQTYNNTVGGVVGEAYGSITFKNVYVDSTNTFGAYWQSHDSCTGGILGYSGSAATVVFESCVSAPVMDVYNDVQANYQYYLYRYSGMLIGNVTDAANSTITTIDTIVGFGDWNQYTYCEFMALGKGSYNGPEEWKYTRTDSGNSLLAPGHTHQSFEDHELLLPFTNLMGRATGGTPDLSWPGTKIENKEYYTLTADHASGGGVYPKGSTVTVTANEYPCCIFKEWIIEDGSDGSQLSSSSTPEVTITLKESLHIRAVYGRAPVATVRPTAAPAASAIPAAPVAPKTGDTTSLAMLCALATIGVVGISLISRKLRKAD